jgi:hypothetical protein
MLTGAVGNCPLSAAPWFIHTQGAMRWLRVAVNVAILCPRTGKVDPANFPRNHRFAMGKCWWLIFTTRNTCPSVNFVEHACGMITEFDADARVHRF